MGVSRKFFLTQNPIQESTSVERSRSMIRLVRRRSNATFFHANALTFTPDDRYDLVVTHFVLDTFTEAQVEALVRRVRKCAPGGLWLCPRIPSRLVWLPESSYG